MNLSVGDRTVRIHASLISGDEYTDTRGVQDILQAWTDRKTRSWLRAGDTFVIATTEGDSLELGEIAPTDDDMYSLNAISRTLGEATSGAAFLAWGEGLNEPDVATQARIIDSLNSRLEMGGMPETRDALVDLFMLVVGEAVR